MIYKREIIFYLWFVRQCCCLKFTVIPEEEGVCGLLKERRLKFKFDAEGHISAWQHYLRHVAPALSKMGPNTAQQMRVY